ncbi:MAG TPA: anti-sigma factor [Flavisolibacter sp.]|jgi:cell division protein FtsL|nr:anti-sigma factor [Flavisolibacter sp.]
MGLLPEEESRKMEQLIVLFPELKAEADRISETLEALAMQTTQAPRPSAKQKIFEQLSTLKDEPYGGENQAPVLPLQMDETDDAPAKVIPLKKKKTNYLLAAMVAGLLLSIATILFLVAENRNKQNDIAALEQRIQSVNQNNAALQEQQLAYEELLRFVQDENIRTIMLQHVPGKPQASAKVFWNQQSKEVFVLDVSLPQAPAGKQYQLWAIVDGKPVSAGLLADQKNRTQKMTAFEQADAFAITLENKGGSASPTLEEMYVMGKTS